MKFNKGFVRYTYIRLTFYYEHCPIPMLWIPWVSMALHSSWTLVTRGVCWYRKLEWQAALHEKKSSFLAERARGKVAAPAQFCPSGVCSAFYFGLRSDNRTADVWKHGCVLTWILQYRRQRPGPLRLSARVVRFTERVQDCRPSRQQVLKFSLSISHCMCFRYIGC